MTYEEELEQIENIYELEQAEKRRVHRQMMAGISSGGQVPPYMDDLLD